MAVLLGLQLRCVGEVFFLLWQDLHPKLSFSYLGTRDYSTQDSPSCLLVGSSGCSVLLPRTFPFFSPRDGAGVELKSRSPVEIFLECFRNVRNSVTSSTASESPGYVAKLFQVISLHFFDQVSIGHKRLERETKWGPPSWESRSWETLLFSLEAMERA